MEKVRVSYIFSFNFMKRFLIKLVSPLYSPILLIIIAFVVYKCLAKDITGDLGKIGQIVFSKEYHLQPKFEENVEKELCWCHSKELKNYDLVFIGDSFTKMGYPCYLCNKTNKNGVQYLIKTESPEQTFMSLYNTEVDLPFVIVLESVERSIVERLTKLYYSSISTGEPIALSYKPEQEKQTDFSTFYKNHLINYHSVRHLHLKESLFSCPKKEMELYFYHDDLRFPDEEQIQIAISKLDTLFQLANKRQIQLFYVIAADKYDVYQDFAIDNPYPKKTVLESFSQFESNPFFVNTRSLLYTKAKEGVTDLYYADDTHWSPVGAKIVAEEIARRMDSLGIFQK